MLGKGIILIRFNGLSQQIIVCVSSDVFLQQSVIPTHIFAFKTFLLLSAEFG